ncbi:unnamed protein product [Colias eurytheme]|nr:unnamed protein product [Colias eurytheme]
MIDSRKRLSNFIVVKLFQYNHISLVVSHAVKTRHPLLRSLASSPSRSIPQGGERRGRGKRPSGSSASSLGRGALSDPDLQSRLQPNLTAFWVRTVLHNPRQYWNELVYATPWNELSMVYATPWNELSMTYATPWNELSMSTLHRVAYGLYQTLLYEVILA